MKSKLLSLLILILCFRVSPVMAFPSGYLQDGDFEYWDDANTLTYWQNSGSSPSLMRLGTSGDYYAQLDVLNGDDKLTTVLGTVNPGELLNGSIYMRGDHSADFLYVDINWYNGNAFNSTERLIDIYAEPINTWILAYPENDSHSGTEARVVPAGVNNATITIWGENTRRSVDIGYFVDFDELVLFDTAMPEVTLPLPVVVFLVVSSLVTSVVIRKKQK